MNEGKYNKFTDNCEIELSSNSMCLLTAVTEKDITNRPVSILTDSSNEAKKKKYFNKRRGENEYQASWSCYEQDPLVLAVRQENESQVRCLVALPNIKAVNMNTALWFACKQNNVNIAELLLEKGASPDYSLCSIPCIHLSALHGSTPLIFAFRNKNPKLIDLRMKESVQLEVTPDRPLVEFPYGALPLHMCAFGRLSSLSLLEELLQGTPEVRNVDVDVGDGSYMSPLMYASKGGNCFSVRALLQKGADIEHKCQAGKTSLLYAAGNGNNSVLELLIKRKACLEVRDNYNEGVFSYSRDEEVANKILSTTISCREESAVELLPIRELITKGYHQTLKNLLDNMVTTSQEDNVCIDLGQLELQPPDWKRKDNLLNIISEQTPDLPLFDSIVLRTYADHHMKRYGYWYFGIKLLELIIYLVALSVVLMLEVHRVNDNITFATRKIILSFSGACVLLRLGLLAMFKIIQFGVIFKHKYSQNLQLSLTRFRPMKTALEKTTYSTVKEYLTDGSNVLDALVLFTALIYITIRVSSIFLNVGSSTSVFAVLLYFCSICLIFRYTIIIPGLGNYIQTLAFALKVSIWFTVVFVINLFAFAGMFYISIGASPYTKPNSNMSLKYDDFRVKFDEEYHWILLTGIRLLIEQGATIKFNYLEVYNWLMVIVFMVFAFVTLLVMRTLYIGKIASEYRRINEAAKRYATHRRLRFLIHLHTKSIYSLYFVKAYLQKYNKKIILNKDKVRAKYPVEYQNLFSQRDQEKVYSKLEELKQDVLERVEAQESKLDEVIRLIQQLNMK